MAAKPRNPSKSVGRKKHESAGRKQRAAAPCLPAVLKYCSADVLRTKAGLRAEGTSAYTSFQRTSRQAGDNFQNVLHEISRRSRASSRHRRDGFIHFIFEPKAHKPLAYKFALHLCKPCLTYADSLRQLEPLVRRYFSNIIFFASE